MEFDAFVSYSHAADGQLAPALQRAMQRLAKPWFRLRSLRVFRDESALSANPHLWASIQTALEGSEWFVLLASPEAASSEWVIRELDYWLTIRHADRILVVVTGGTWQWDPTTHTLIGNAVPEVLRNTFVDEPRHVDIRWAHSDVHLDMRNPRFRDAVAEVSAPIRGVAKDELESDDVRLHRRTIRTARIGIIALVLLTILSLLAGFIAVGNANRASQNRATAEFNLLVSQSHDLIGYQRDVALLLSVEARRMRDNIASRGALEAALAQEPRFAGYVFDRRSTTGFTSVCPLGEANTVAAGGRDGSVGIYNLVTGLAIAPRVELDRHPKSGGVVCASSRDGTTLIAGDLDTGQLWTLNPTTAKPKIGPHDTGGSLDAVAVSPNGRTVVAGAVDGGLHVWNPGEPGVAGPNLVSGSQNVGVAFSPDGMSLVTSGVASSGDQEILVWDTTTWTMVTQFPDPTTDIPGCQCDRRSDAGDGVVRPTVTRTALTVSPDGQSLLVTTSLYLRDYALSGRLQWQVQTPYTNSNSAVFTANGKMVVAQTAGDELRLLDSTSGQQSEPSISSQVGSATLAVTKENRVIAAPSERPILASWDLVPRVIAHAISAPTSYVALQYSADGQQLLVQDASSSDPLFADVSVWDEQHTKLVPLPKVVFPTFTEGHLVGGIFASVGSLATFDVDAQKLTAARIPFDLLKYQKVESHSFSGPARRLLVGRPGGGIAEFSIDGRTIIDPWVKLKGFPYSIDAEAPNRVAVGLRDSGDTVVLDLATGRQAFPPIHNLRYATFSPDGSRLAGFAGPSRVQVYDGRTGAPLGHPLVAPPGSEELQFSNEGSLLAVRAQQGTSIYEVNSGQVIGDPFPTTDYAVLRPDGKELATPTAQGTLLWSLNPDRWQGIACRLAGRNLTRAEWTRFLPSDESYHATCPQWPKG